MNLLNLQLSICYFKAQRKAFISMYTSIVHVTYTHMLL